MQEAIRKKGAEGYGITPRSKTNEVYIYIKKDLSKYL